MGLLAQPKSAVVLVGIDPPAPPHNLTAYGRDMDDAEHVNLWTAAFLGMSAEMLERVYGHHHPDFLEAATRGISYGRRRKLAI